MVLFNQYFDHELWIELEIKGGVVITFIEPRHKKWTKYGETSWLKDEL
jgi:hypothetical protein